MDWRDSCPNPYLASVAWHSSQSGRALPDWLERQALLANPYYKALLFSDF